MPSRSSSGRRGGTSHTGLASRSGAHVPPRPCIIDLPGWREPSELLGRLSPGRRPALLCSGALSGETGRYSILAADPVLTVSWRSGEGVIEGPDGPERTASDDPFGLLESLVRRGRSLGADRWPFPGGAIGYFSYDAGRALERLPELAVDDRPFPWMDFAFYSWAINWDHLS
ncbi:MAG TPA: hypothetical protein VNI57_15640, partial [Candidatus Saccharimonadales bacterium]|nr:hypothetical protein [Candidatus Saccharimonadales bacterium]